MEVEDYNPDDSQDEPRSRRMEMLVGLGLVALVLGFVLFSYVKQEAQVGHYRAGVDALNAREPDRAIEELTAAESYMNSAALIEQARSEQRKRDALYSQATEYAGAGKWWQTARILIQMQAVQTSYKDSDTLLARAREINGPIFYTHLPPETFLEDGTKYNTYDGPDQDGIYMMEADGKESVQVESLSRMMRTYAVSRDGRFLAFSIPEGQPRLYDATRRITIMLDLPGDPEGAAVRQAEFTPDGNTLAIKTVDKAYLYDLRQLPAENMGHLTYASKLNRPDYENSRLKTLTLLIDAQGATQVAVRVYTSTQPVVLATEAGTVDGALFTKDQRYLLYRVCEATNGGKSFECALRLSDLANAGEVQTIASIPNLTLSASAAGLLGEFTRDGNHVLIFIEYRGDAETLVYSIESGETSKINPRIFASTTGRGEADVYAVGKDYLLDDYVPGLQSWVGPNTLARTQRTIRRQTDRFARVSSHWVTVSPNNRFVLALSLHITESSRFYRLQVAPLTWNTAEAPDAGRTLISTKMLPREWVPSLQVLPDGYTLIAATTESLATSSTDVKAYSLDIEGETEAVLAPSAHLLDLYSFPEQK